MGMRTRTDNEYQSRRQGLVQYLRRFVYTLKEGSHSCCAIVEDTNPHGHTTTREITIPPTTSLWYSGRKIYSGYFGKCASQRQRQSVRDVPEDNSSSPSWSVECGLMLCEIGSSSNEVPRRSPFQMTTQLESDKPVEYSSPLHLRTRGRVKGQTAGRRCWGELGWLTPGLLTARWGIVPEKTCLVTLRGWSRY